MRRFLAAVPERVLDYAAAIGGAFFFGYGLGQITALSSWWCR